MVTIGLSIVFADLMLWVFGGDFYQIQTPAWLVGPIELPFVTAVKSSGEAVYLQYPIVRLVIFAAPSSIGVAMWLALNRTRIGMIVRAGVDDRDILAAMGVQIQLVFVVVFAFGAGLAGMAGVVGGTFQSLSPGEDTRFLLASLVVVIVGGMGSIPGAALGALIIGLAEQLGSVYIPTYAIVRDLPHHGARAGRSAAGPAGERAEPWRSSTDPSRAPRRPRPPRRDCRGRIDPVACWSRRPADLAAAARQRLLPDADFRPDRCILGIIALSLMFLAGYGGMVSLMQLTLAGFAGYMFAMFGVSGTPTSASAGRGGSRRRWRSRSPRSFGTIGGALAVRTEGIYTIMITLAIAAAFYYFTNQNYAIFNGHTGINTIATPAFLGRRLARRHSLLLSDPRHRGALLFRASPMSRARLSGSHCRACATIRAAWPRSASTSTRIASPPTPSPPSSRRSAAFCWSGTTGRSRRARSASTAAIDILDHRRRRRHRAAPSVPSSAPSSS